MKLTREVRPARTYGLELLSILAAVGALLYASACATYEPGLGHVYQCEAAFVCDDASFTVTPADGCAEDLEEAYDLYVAKLDELVAGARCNESHFETLRVDTSKLCTP